MGFLPLHPVSLDLPQLDRLAVEAASAGSNLVISLQGDAVGEEAAAILERTRGLKAGGLRQSCADTLTEGPLASLASLADYLLVDVAALDPASLLERQ